MADYVDLDRRFRDLTPQAPLREKESRWEPPETKERTVVLLPLGGQQISKLTQSCGVENTAAFMEELDRRGTQRFWKHPQTKARLVFPAVLEHLRRIAEELEAENGYEVRLLVHSLDLAGPTTMVQS